jgi:Flp pilus assembly pilin Flp
VKPRPRKQKPAVSGGLRRADDGVRTRDPQLGKLMLYQLSYVRVPKKGPAPSLQQGLAKKRLQADDLTVRTLLDLHRADGQTMAEYSIILAVITPAIVFTISLLSDRVAGLFTALPSLIP